MNKRFLSVSGLLFLATLALAACEKTVPTESNRDVPSAKVEAGILSDGVSFRVAVPPGHHAYVDSGSQGNLIPVSFIWDESINPAPELRSSPTGNYDEEFEAKVLRGSGIWEFSYPNPEKLKDQVVQVRSQVCDEVTGICYRPTFQKLTISM